MDITVTILLLTFICLIYVLYKIVESVLDRIIDKKNITKYWSENKGKTLFFYSNKRGWADFVINNILPVLPKDTIVYNLNVDKENPSRTIYNIVDQTKASFDDTRLPFIIKLNEGKPLIYSFSADFKTIKNNNSKVDLGVQKLVSEKLNRINSH